MESTSVYRAYEPVEDMRTSQSEIPKLLVSANFRFKLSNSRVSPPCNLPHEDCIKETICRQRSLAMTAVERLSDSSFARCSRPL